MFRIGEICNFIQGIQGNECFIFSLIANFRVNTSQVVRKEVGQTGLPVITTTQSSDKWLFVRQPIGLTIHSLISLIHSCLILFYSFRLQPMIWLG